jgi:hypothetical protein
MKDELGREPDMQESDGFWKSKKGKITLGGLFSVALAAAAGFLSPEVRTLACLELPNADELVYPHVEGGVPYRELASQAMQPSFDNQNVSFSARAYAEQDRTIYSGYLEPSFRSYSVAYVVGVDEKVQQGPFGREIPRFGVLLSPELAKQWSSVASGAAVKIEGRAEFLHDYPENSDIGKQRAAMRRLGQDLSGIRVPEFADSWVVAKSVTPLRALNDPRDRTMCKWRKFDS